MEIKKSIKGTLSKEEVEKIIKDYLKTQGYEATNIFFDVKEEEMEDDTFSQYPLTPVFKGIRFECE
jgi:hypothetical protein